MTAADDEKRRIEQEERVRSIFDRGEDHRKAQRTAAVAAERQRTEAREAQKTSSFATWLLLALLATLILAVYDYFVASGGS
jgi:hypothetical protein